MKLLYHRTFRRCQDGFLITIALAWAGVMVWGAFPDPHKSMAALGGLTPDQVIAHLGPPSQPDPRKINPRSPRDPVWTPAREAEMGPLTLNYRDAFPRWKAYYYVIVFQNNRVAQINLFRK